MESAQMAASNFISMGARLPDCKQSNLPAGTARRSALFATVDCKIKRFFHVFELMFAEKIRNTDLLSGAPLIYLLMDRFS